jgi:hypothetical protein
MLALVVWVIKNVVGGELIVVTFTVNTSFYYINSIFIP